MRDLGHLDLTRAARHRFQLAARLAGLVPGGERFPRARFALHLQLHAAKAAAPRAARTAGSPGDGQLTGRRPGAQSLNGTGTTTGAVIAPGSRATPATGALPQARAGNDRAVTRGARNDPMTDPQNTPVGFSRLIQLWTIQLRSLTEGLTGMAGLSQSVLSQSVPSLQGLPHPGALSAAQLNLIASSVASQRQGIAAM